MTTVLKPGEAPRDNTGITLVSDDGSHAYGRPTAGNNAPTAGGPDGGAGIGPGPTDSDAPAGVIPTNPVYGAIEYFPPAGSLSQAGSDSAVPEVSNGAPTSTGDTQVGPDMGYGATIMVPLSGDRPSGGAQAYDDSDPGTVGDSGPQL